MSAPATARSGASNTATRTSLPITYSTGVTARERPPLPRLGNGYEPPGKLDCFADGTPALGEPLPEQWTETIKKKKKKARNPRKKMPPEVMDAVHEKLVEATNRRCDPDRGDLFDVADKDASGTMELDELKKLVRVTLRIPPGELSNDMIKGVFQAIDYSGNGSIETSEFEAFLEHGSSVMHMSQQITEVVTSVVWPVETNPSAGTVRMRELDKPFLEDALRETRMENKKDEEVLGEKLVFNLAKQTSKGLKEHLGVHCEMTNVANVVRLAIRNETKTAAEIDDMSNGDEVRKAREVLKAVRQFNLRKVAKLMSVDVPQPPTWGGRSRNATSEDPAVTLRRLVK